MMKILIAAATPRRREGGVAGVVTGAARLEVASNPPKKRLRSISRRLRSPRRAAPARGRGDRPYGVRC